MLSPVQADGLFDVLREELEVDPACRELLLAALTAGAERIRFTGFSSLPKSDRPRLLLVREDLEHIRCPEVDQEKMGLEEKRKVVSASRRIADILAAPPIAPVGARSRLSAMAA